MREFLKNFKNRRSRGDESSDPAVSRPAGQLDPKRRRTGALQDAGACQSTPRTHRTHTFGAITAAYTAFFAIALVLSACKQAETVATQASPSTPASAVAATAPPPSPASIPEDLGEYDPSGGHPQPKLQTLKLWVGTNEVTAELAITPRQIETGMMRRTNMVEMDGMLFVFPQPRQISFYMKNTLLPLSCAYIDPEGTILEIYDMKPLDKTPIPSKSDQVQYVLEMNQGWFERHGIKPGVAVSTERGTFPQTFRRR